MNADTVALLVNTLGPIVLPALISALTWLGSKVLGHMSPQVQDAVKPIIPTLLAGIGAAVSAANGGSAMTGAVYGLAATGIHQAVTQPQKAKA